MTLGALLEILADSPLIASVQASEDSPLADVEILTKLARASLENGSRVLRLDGAGTIQAIGAELGVPVIGLIKRDYEGSAVRITPTEREVEELLATRAEVIAIDATLRSRPGGARFADLVKKVKAAARLVLADCDSVESARAASAAGVDLLSTTLAGYTGDAFPPRGPDLELLRSMVSLGTPVLAEGRYSQPWEVQAAMRIGAKGVVVGGALNDPVKQTRILAQAAGTAAAKVGAFDIGGTWIRFGLFDGSWRAIHSEREALPNDAAERLAWMKHRVELHDLERVAISTGGTVDPLTARVFESKDLIPGNVGQSFSEISPNVIALNDGLATAWGHACLPQFAGKRVATIAFGTGIGCGLVGRGTLLSGPRGEYPRLNDVPFEDRTLEAALGGASLDGHAADWDLAHRAYERSVELVQRLWLPDAVVISGSVGLSDRFSALRKQLGVLDSPFGRDAGLYGAAALCLFPPTQFQSG